MTAPAVTFSLAARDRRRLLVDWEDGTYTELVGTVTAVHPATVDVRAEDGRELSLHRRQILHAVYPGEPIPFDDPARHCKPGAHYQFVHPGPDGFAVDTAGELRILATGAVLVDVGDVNLAVIARASIYAVKEFPA